MKFEEPAMYTYRYLESLGMNCGCVKGW